MRHRTPVNCLRSRVIGMFPAPRRAKAALKSIGQSERAHRLLPHGASSCREQHRNIPNFFGV
jgi:hypothetical protein